jgi:hypothetical protein
MTRKRKVPSFERYRGFILGTVRDLAKSFTQPKEDWEPVLHLVTKKSRSVLLSLKEVLADKETKVCLPIVVMDVFKRHRPVLSALVMSCWYVQLVKDDPLLALSLELNAAFGSDAHPNRREIVAVEVASKQGQSETWSALIQRSADKPPTLAAWSKWGEPTGGRIGMLLKDTYSALR